MLRLLPILPSGLPCDDVGPLPEIAQSVCSTTAVMYEVSGFAPPWVAYLAVLDGIVVGTCAFKTPPVDGRVEIAYFTFREYEGKGIATEMARELVRMAREAAPDIIIAAQTLPQPGASPAILHKLGFVLVGTVEHPDDGEVWEWQIAAAPE